MAKTPRLKIFMEQPGFAVGCVELEYADVEMESYQVRDERVEVGSILVDLEKDFGDRIRVDLIDPRNILSLLDVLRFRVRGTEATWVLNGKLLARGVPDREYLWNEINRTLTS